MIIIIIIKDNIFDKKDSIFSFSSRGAVTQNASERVGSVCLKYRPKGTFMKDVQYRAATDLCIIHVNTVVIGVVRNRLVANGISDPELDAFGSSFEAKLYDMLGLHADDHQLEAWEKRQQRRVTQSLYRRSDDFKRKRATQRKQLAEKRKAETKKGKADYTYKDSHEEKPSKDKGRRLVHADVGPMHNVPTKLARAW